MYQIKPTLKFEKSFSNLIKTHYKKNTEAQQQLQQKLVLIVQELTVQGTTHEASWEAFPYGTELNPKRFSLHKIRFNMPQLKGLAKHGRLIYLVDADKQYINLLWIYTYSEFAKRPPDKDLDKLIKEYLTSEL